MTVRAAAQACETTVGHLRTRDGGHEVDLIVERYDGAVVAIEVKLAASVTDSDVRHLHWLAGQLGDRLADAVVLTTGADAYRRPDGIAVIPLALLRGSSGGVATVPWRDPTCADGGFRDQGLWAQRGHSDSP